MRAYALSQWARHEFGDDIRLEVYHALESGSRLGDFGVRLYNQIQRHAPWLHNIYWFIAEAFGWFNARGWGIGIKVWRKKLESFKPHLVISMHDSLNRGYLAAARRVLGENRVRCIIYCGEWSGGFGFSRNWVDKAAHRIYVRRTEVIPYVEQLGYPKGQVQVFCNLLRPRNFEPPMTASEVVRFRAVSLGLDPSRFTLFLATGALGADRHIAFLNALVPFADRLQVIVVSGRNKEAFDRISLWASEHPGFRICQEGFSRRMHLLMQASDCILTRGGANTMAEATFFKCPVLFHAHGGLMPQERCTLRFLQQNGIGEHIRSPRHLAKLMQQWLDQPESFATLRSRLEKVSSEDKPWIFVRDLAAIGDEVLHAQ